MSKKKLKGKICAYCFRVPATTDDHIFARQFFSVQDRADLPKAPACADCNRKKSLLEHYLTAVLPFGGRHVDAVEDLLGGVPKRLDRNQRLARDLAMTTRRAWLREGQGICQETRSFAFDGRNLDQLLRLIGRGLAWRHWRIYLGSSDRVYVQFLSDADSHALMRSMQQMTPAEHVEVDLAGGTVHYFGARAMQPPQLTIWAVQMFGGVVLADSREPFSGVRKSSTVWWILTCAQSLADDIPELWRFARRHG